MNTLLAEHSEIKVNEITDTVGAVEILRQRFRRENYSVDSLHQLVKHNRIKAFMFQDGELVERPADAKTRGKDLFFLRADLDKLPLPRRGKPPGSKKLS